MQERYPARAITVNSQHHDGKLREVKVDALPMHLPGHLPGRPPVHQTMNDDNRRPVG